MEFTQIPANGSSWQERLCYKFSSEETQPQDLDIEIIDHTTNQTLGTMRLYNTNNGEIDIAPYLRDKLRLTPSTPARAIQLTPSPSAIAVCVAVNGARSEVRHFFRAAYNPNTTGPLSYKAISRDIRQGDAIRLTLFAQSVLDVVVTYDGVTVTQPTRLTLKTNGLPSELIIPTEHLRGIKGVDVSIQYDGGNIQTINYVVLPKSSTVHRLVWFNPKGGIESYTFDHALRLGYSISSEEIIGVDHEIRKQVEGRQKYRICTGYDTSREIARVVELLLSPMVFSEQSGLCTPVDVENREVNFDSKGLLHSFALDISEEWKGGEL